MTIITNSKELSMRSKIIFAVASLIILASCEKYRDLNNLETTINSYGGTIDVSESTGNATGVFSGTNQSGAYGFIWDNPGKDAILNTNVSVDSGYVMFIIEDSRGEEVLNALSSGGTNTYLIKGKKGKWKVRLVFGEFEGDGTFTLSPVN
jgi:hypothetical protein